MFERYKSYSPYDMLESIKKEVKGDLEIAFVNLGKETEKEGKAGHGHLGWAVSRQRTHLLEAHQHGPEGGEIGLKAVPGFLKKQK